MENIDCKSIKIFTFYEHVQIEWLLIIFVKISEISYYPHIAVIGSFEIE